MGPSLDISFAVKDEVPWLTHDVTLSSFVVVFVPASAFNHSSKLLATPPGPGCLVPKVKYCPSVKSISSNVTFVPDRLDAAISEAPEVKSPSASVIK